jgi:hypothetical protein
MDIGKGREVGRYKLWRGEMADGETETAAMFWDMSIGAETFMSLVVVWGKTGPG